MSTDKSDSIGNLMHENAMKRKLYWEKKVGDIYKMPFPVEDNLIQWLNYNPGEQLKVAGRILSKRILSKVAFLKIFDHSLQINSNAVSASQEDKKSISDLEQSKSAAVQLIIKPELEDYKNIIKNLAYGDIIAVKGIITHSGTGERSIEVTHIQLISCNYLQVAEKYHGIVNEDFRHRHTYMVYASDQEFRNTIDLRIKITQKIREFFYAKQFLEVETPILQKVASGAAARPFKTHHNSLSIDLFLRIAPELKLKTMIAAGYTKIFEIGKNFRNEGIDPTHLQEFTMLECYAAYWHYSQYMDFTRELFLFICKQLELPTTINFRGHEIDLGAKWKVEHFTKLILRETAIDVENSKDLKGEIINYLKKQNQETKSLNKINTYMGLVDFIYKKICRPKIIQPTFMVGYPSYMAPLATVENGYSTKMQMIIGGIEFVNCYSELVDPAKQEENFSSQQQYQQQNNFDGSNKPTTLEEEAEDIFRRDYEFMRAMEYGMPPMAGYGLGIDRLICLFTGNENLKNTIMFPIVIDKNPA